MMEYAHAPVHTCIHQSLTHAKQNNFLLDTEKHSLGCCFTRCFGVINLGSLEQVPLDLFLPFGGLLQSIFHLRDNSEAVGVRKESINDLAVVEESEIVIILKFMLAY